MGYFQDTFETRKGSFISALPVHMTVHLTSHGMHSLHCLRLCLKHLRKKT